MKTRMHSKFTAAGIAALSVVLGLAACQNPDSFPIPSSPSEVPEATPARAAAVLGAGDTSEIFCTVNYDDRFSLGSIPDQAYLGYSYPDGSGYVQTCNLKDRVTTKPISHARMVLAPEFSTWCSGTKPKIGAISGASCVSQTDGKNWPRTAGNMGKATGVKISVGAKNFDINSIEIISGNVKLTGYRPGIGAQTWSLVPGTTEFPDGTTFSSMEIFDQNKNGSFRFDNLKINIK